MAIEFVQLNDSTTTGARVAGDVVTGATPSDNVFFQTVQLVKGATGAAKTVVTSGEGLPVIIDNTATIILGAGTATIGRIGPNTATIGVVGLSSAVVLAAGTATVGSVNLSSPSGNSLTTDGVLLVQVGAGAAAIGTVDIGSSTATFILEASTATIGSIANVNTLVQTTATTILGGSTATIGDVRLRTATGGSLSTDGALIVIPQSTATTILGAGTASIGNVHLTENTATLILSAGTATVGFVTLASGTATAGTVHVVIDGAGVGTATGGRIVPKFASFEFTASAANSTATIVGAVAGTKIRPISYVMAAQGTVNVQWTSATTANLSGFMALASQTGVAANFNPYGHMETVTGALLGLRSSVSGQTVAGHITYIEATT
jgi:hypothetical protein